MAADCAAAALLGPADPAPRRHAPEHHPQNADLHKAFWAKFSYSLSIVQEGMTHYMLLFTIMYKMDMSG